MKKHTDTRQPCIPQIKGSSSSSLPNSLSPLATSSVLLSFCLTPKTNTPVLPCTLPHSIFSLPSLVYTSALPSPSRPPLPSYAFLHCEPFHNRSVCTSKAMVKFVAALFLFVLPAIAIAARPASQPMLLQGKVYCDTCRAGFETPASTYITGAKVRVECKDIKTMQLLYSQDTTTDSTGSYKILVSKDHQDQICDTLLVSSPVSDCNTPAAGRDRARVILTRNNGMASDNRYANAMGFMKNKAMDGCTKVLQMYQDFA